VHAHTVGRGVRVVIGVGEKYWWCVLAYADLGGQFAALVLEQVGRVDEDGEVGAATELIDVVD